MSLIKVSDFVARFLMEQGIEDLFLVSGGGIMHLLDSVGRQAGLRYWCNYHEQLFDAGDGIGFAGVALFYGVCGAGIERRKEKRESRNT